MPTNVPGVSAKTPRDTDDAPFRSESTQMAKASRGANDKFIKRSLAEAIRQNVMEPKEYEATERNNVEAQSDYDRAKRETGAD